MTNDERNYGAHPVPPYGPPIWEAINRGDIHEMEAVAAAARRALHRVEFLPVTESNREEVVAALNALEAKLAELKGGHR